MDTSEHSSRYTLRDDGTFVVRDYHASKPFSSFLPGIAGLWGTPLWLYLVNRGQAVACFGTTDKDHAIMEFKSAELHYRQVGLEGFRTFIKLTRDGRTKFYEPFRSSQPHFDVWQEMQLTASGIRLSETNSTLQVRVDVDYLTVANEPFAALGRSVTISDLSGSGGTIDVIDGAAKIVPYGETAEWLKRLPFVTMGYLNIQNLENRLPFLNLKAQPSDTAETEFLHAGNFFFGFDEEDKQLLPAFVDPEPIFGDQVDLIRPYGFLDSEQFDDGAFQATSCIMPCGMLHWQGELAPDGSRTLRSLYGFARRLDAAVAVPDKARRDGWFRDQAALSASEVQRIHQQFFVHTGSAKLNQYIPQTFLDNVLRGGLPVTLPAGKKNFVYHVYSRRHGDLERDYNNFRLEPTHFSQGNGAYRDVNQNRRNDAWFNPDVGAQNLKWFFNLIQPDGFNPMLVKGARFRIVDHRRLAEIVPHAVEQRSDDVVDFLARPFTPGSLFEFLEDSQIPLAVPAPEFLEQVLQLCEKVEEAEFESGYWCDHWYYNFDLLESFQSIYPDRLRDLLIEDGSFTYWDPDIRVKPRDEKYVLYSNGKVRHVESIEEDGRKAALIASRTDMPRKVRTEDGLGEVYSTNLLEKIVCLLANKVASISPSGVGVEMDGGRPGWHDSINGLPSLFGASTSETFHLLRAIRMVRDCLKRLDLTDEHAQTVPVEVAELVATVRAALDAYLSSDTGDRDYLYWDAANTAKEAYRRKVRMGFSGRFQELTVGDVRRLLDAAEKRIESSMPQATDPDTGLPVTYVIHEPAEWEELSEVNEATGGRGPKLTPRGFPCVRVTRFRLHRYPLFLEAPTHAMRIESDSSRAREIYETIRRSPLHDEKLNMYLLADSVQDESPETGRIWAWAPGWFENENVFMHMEHKYLLSQVKAGLFEEFYRDYRACGVPFQDPEIYGRSPLENTSFIYSSRHPRPDYHGRGALPRSSGTTSEVLNMFLWVLFGQRPFRMENGDLCFGLSPAIPDWFFTAEPTQREVVDRDGRPRQYDLPADSCSAMLFGSTLVTYVNPSRHATFGPDAVTVQGYEFIRADGSAESVDGPVVRGTLAEQVREQQFRQIVVRLA
ncbi:MAG: hypothetical protein ACLFVU_06610 [Phycisphaerae bacterium]